MVTPFLIPTKTNNNNNFVLLSHRYVFMGDGPKGFEPIPGSVRFLYVHHSLFVAMFDYLPFSSLPHFDIFIML